MEGWIKLHRKLLNNDFWIESTPEQKVIMVTILMMANYTEDTWEYKGETYVCKAGEFITSIQNIERLAGKNVTSKKIRTCLKKLKENGIIDYETSNKNTKIVICNWELYQSKDDTKKKTEEKQDVYKVLKIWNEQDVIKVGKTDTDTKRYKLILEKIEQCGLESVIETVRKVDKGYIANRRREQGKKIDIDWFLKNKNYELIVTDTVGKEVKNGLQYCDTKKKDTNRKFNIKPCNSRSDV